MTTILTQKVGSGPTRTCSATCHKAAKPKCVCICGGKYHGIARGKEGPRSVEEAERLVNEKVSKEIAPLFEGPSPTLREYWKVPA